MRDALHALWVAVRFLLPESWFVAILEEAPVVLYTHNWAHNGRERFSFLSHELELTPISLWDPGGCNEAYRLPGGMSTTEQPYAMHVMLMHRRKVTGAVFVDTSQPPPPRCIQQWRKICDG